VRRRGRRAAFGLGNAELRAQRVEALAVLGEVDGRRARPQDRDPGVGERAGQLQRGLTPEADDHAGELAAPRERRADREDVLAGEWLEEESVAGVVVGRDRLGVAV